MSLYDYDPVLMNYMAQQKAKQAQVPPALIPPQAKKGWMDKLGSMLIQGDESWQPDDATRKQMVKKGLLEAGLSMLANPTGGDGSALAGISGGLLKGIGQMNNEANELRGRSFNVNSNRMTDTQRAMAIIQDPNAPAQVREAAMVFLKLNPPAKAETFNTMITPDGQIVQGSNHGGFDLYGTGSTSPTRYSGNQTPVSQQPQAPQNAEGQDAKRLKFLYDDFRSQGYSDAQANDMAYAKFKETGLVEQAPPPRYVTESKPLPNLGKPDAPKAAPALTDYDKKRANIVAKYGEDVAIEWDATGKLPISAVPPVSTKNERQLGGESIARDAALERASALTGLPIKDLMGMSQQQFESAVILKGKRIFQGPILGKMPIISDATNADVNSWTDQGGSGIALQMNPTGMITGADVNVGKGIFANSGDPIEVQARKMWKAISGSTAPPSNAAKIPAKNSKGWILHTDKNGNKAYVSPDGKQYEEVK